MISLKFVDHYKGFDPTTDRIFTFLQRYFQVALVNENPDFIIYSSWGSDHLKYNCPKIFYTGENHRPNLYLCDYALGFDFIDGPNYLRVPLYSILWYYDFSTLLFPKHQQVIEANPKSKFCCFVSSNLGAKVRNDFFLRLSKYKQVDSGGKVLNNLGGLVSDKIEFMRPYKFCIAYENSSFPGYVTEKIMDCFIAGCIPIYWGSPNVEVDFNSKRILNRRDFKSDHAFILRIKELDQDENAYQDFISQPILPDNKFTEYFEEARLKNFFERIFSGPKNTRSKSIRKLVGKSIRNLKKAESIIKNKIGGYDRVWY